MSWQGNPWDRPVQGEEWRALMAPQQAPEPSPEVRQKALRQAAQTAFKPGTVEDPTQYAPTIQTGAGIPQAAPAPQNSVLADMALHGSEWINQKIIDAKGVADAAVPAVKSAPQAAWGWIKGLF